MKRQSALTAVAVVLVVAIGLLTWTKSASEEFTMPNISTADVLKALPKGFIVAFLSLRGCGCDGFRFLHLHTGL